MTIKTMIEKSGHDDDVFHEKLELPFGLIFKSTIFILR